MKRFTLLFVSVLLTLATLAQENTVVTPPAGLQTESWLLTAQRYDSNEYTVDAVLSLNIGFQGQEVYIQGLNMYLPEAWVKGTMSNGQVTVAVNQYCGPLSDGEGTTYETFFAGCDVSWFDGQMGLLPIDVVFTINEAGDRWTTGSVLVVNSQTDAIMGFDYLKDVTIAKPIAGAATPKAPTFAMFKHYDATNGYGGVALDFPPVSVNGEPLMTEKLSYIVYKDVEHEVSAISFPAWSEDTQEYVDMTEIPYNFTDHYNIEARGYAAYFYEPSGSWNRVGVKAIYTGGDEIRESEVTWMQLRPFADEASVFDFNAMSTEDRPVSTSSSHAGDITANEVLKSGDVTLTITPSGGNTANRYWHDYNLQAIQLRLYGGTLTFDVPEGKMIEQIYFYTTPGYWNEYNEFDSGECVDGVWTGSAQQVVMTVDGGQPNTRLNSIAVVVKDATGLRTVNQLPVEVLHTFDLQGREVSASTKGLVLRQVRQADGTLKTMKVLQ